MKQLKNTKKYKKSDIIDGKGDDYMNDPIIIQSAANLAEIAARNGASIISDKIKKARANKDLQKTINELEEIINDLIADKNQMQMIAQSYEQELISQKITEDDIKYITKNILPIFKEFIPDKIQIEQLEKILSVETLTIMQLIGFNYKQAIGEPLTLLARKTIESKIPMDSKVNIEYVLAMASLAKDAESTKRYFQLTGQNIPIDNAN